MGRVSLGKHFPTSTTFSDCDLQIADDGNGNQSGTARDVGSATKYRQVNYASTTELKLD